MGFETQEVEGVSIKTNLVGYGGSSTRAELAAIILALSADIPIHAGTDSKAFIDKAKWVQQLAKARKNQGAHGQPREMAIFGFTFIKH